MRAEGYYRNRNSTSETSCKTAVRGREAVLSRTEGKPPSYFPPSCVIITAYISIYTALILDKLQLHEICSGISTSNSFKMNINREQKVLSSSSQKYCIYKEKHKKDMQEMGQIYWQNPPCIYMHVEYVKSDNKSTSSIVWQI